MSALTSGSLHPEWIRRATNKKPSARPGFFNVCVTVRVLLQVEFLSGPRTQNSSDLATVDRALVLRRQSSFYLFCYRIGLGSCTIESRPVFIVDHQINVWIILAPGLHRDHPVANDISGHLSG